MSLLTAGVSLNAISGVSFKHRSKLGANTIDKLTGVIFVTADPAMISRVYISLLSVNLANIKTRVRQCRDIINCIIANATFDVPIDFGQLRQHAAQQLEALVVVSFRCKWIGLVP